MRLIFLMFALFILTASGNAQGEAQPRSVNVDSIYLARDDGSGHAGDPATRFSPSDIPIYCVVQLDSATPVTVRMNLVAEKVDGVKADTKVVSVSYTTKDGQNRVNFTGRPEGKWIAGIYRADIYLNDKLAKNASFEIVATAKPVAAANLVSPAPPKRTPRKHD